MNGQTTKRVTLTFEFFAFLCTFSLVDQALKIVGDQTIVAQDFVDVHVVVFKSVFDRRRSSRKIRHQNGATSNHYEKLDHFVIIIFWILL